MTILFMSFHLSILSFISQLFVVYLLHSISFIAHSFFTNGMKSLFFYFFCHKRTATYFLIRYPPPPPNPHSQTSISNFTFQMFNSHPRSCHPSVPVLLLLFPTLVSFFCAFMHLLFLKPISVPSFIQRKSLISAITISHRRNHCRTDYGSCYRLTASENDCLG